MNIGICGAGSWAIALAVLLHNRGHKISMWEFNKNDAEKLLHDREHKVKLPGIIIPHDVQITNDIAQTAAMAKIMFLVVPSQTLRSTLQQLVSKVDTSLINSIEAWVIASKGIECGSLKLMSEVTTEILSPAIYDKLVILSGPSHAEEVSRNIPTTIVAASKNLAVAEKIQAEISTPNFRVYTNHDVTGVELAASVKNVIAVAAGICDGLGFGDNTKGALLTRGMVEMIRLGKKMGAEEQTFTGLAGFGDLITTCISKHSRNRNFGHLIGSGLSLQQALQKMTMVVEGVETTKSVYALSQKYAIEMPITKEVYLTLFEGKSPKAAVKDLMMRQWKSERE